MIRPRKQKRIPLAEVKDDFSRVLHAAEKEPIVITRHGKPAGVLIGFADEEDWLEYRLLNDPRFQARIAAARDRFRKGEGIPIEQLAEDRFKE